MNRRQLNRGDIPESVVRNFLQKHPEGASVQEIAEVLGEPHGNVNYELKRIFKKIIASGKLQRADLAT